MNNHNFFVKILAKLDNLINSQLKKNLNKLNFIFEKDKLLAFLSLKRIFIIIMVLFVSLFSYLSAPHLYNNKKLVANIKNRLSENLNLDFNLSNNYKYNLFPKPNFEFNPPRLPQYDSKITPPKGTMDKLLELGPEKFSKWILNEKQLLITDTTLRDAHQSLLATRVRTYDMLAVADAIAKNTPSLFSLEMWGGATFDSSMRFLKEDPWQRLKLLR